MTISQAGAMAAVQALIEIEEIIADRLAAVHQALPERDKDEAGMIFRGVRDAVVAETQALKQGLARVWLDEQPEWPDNDDDGGPPTQDIPATTTMALPDHLRPELGTFAALASDHIDRRKLGADGG